jgi:predicted nucleic acid-binding protein
MMAHAHWAGLTIGTIDALLAATAAAHRLTPVTRNVADVERLGVRRLNPWDASRSVR